MHGTFGSVLTNEVDGYMGLESLVLGALVLGPRLTEAPNMGSEDHRLIRSQHGLGDALTMNTLSLYSIIVVQGPRWSLPVAVIIVTL